MTMSIKRSKTRQRFRIGTKYNDTSPHMLVDHCYELGLLMQPSGLKKKLLGEGDPPPLDIFLLRPGSAPGQKWPKHLNACAGL